MFVGFLEGCCLFGSGSMGKVLPGDGILPAYGADKMATL